MLRSLDPPESMKIVSIVGARPQFIKAAPLGRALREKHHEILVHTGQHYDTGMSGIFFEELDLPQPDVNLGVGSGPHGWQTAKMLAGLEELLNKERPDWVLVYGDTNSTLAGALAASKLNLSLAHVEAGLRSFDRSMPEEINRRLTDHCAQLLLCPTQTAVDNLASEGIREGVHLIGDVMCDALRHFLPRVDQKKVLARFELAAGEYVLATIHRPANTDQRETLAAVLDCLAASRWPVLLPAHPRTREALQGFGLATPAIVRLVEPLSYLQMLALERNARAIVTDSGGVQKEACMLGVPCITLREETEWVETVQAGWNSLVGHDPQKAAYALTQPRPAGPAPALFGDGLASPRIVALLESATPPATRR